MPRIESVELIRLISIFAVILIHTMPFLDENTVNNIDRQNVWGVIIKQACTFAVPFFFIISGYFLGKKTDDKNQMLSKSKGQCWRLLKLFLFWSFIYVTPYQLSAISGYGLMGPLKAWYWNLNSLLVHPFYLLFEGTKGHLWFLMSLIWALLITSYLVYKEKQPLLIILALALYIFGLLTKGYAETPVGIKIEFNSRSGPIYSTIFFITGYFLAKFKPKVDWFYWGGIILVAGISIKAIEIYFLWTDFHKGLLEDYLIGTLPIGLGMAMIALSMHPILIKKPVTQYSKYVLGIYTSHVLFVDNFKPLGKIFSNNWFWQLSYPILVFCASLWMAHSMGKSKFFRQFVV